MFFLGVGMGRFWSITFDGYITFWLDSLTAVPDQSSELGGAELGRRLPSPDAGQHALADWHLQPAGPVLHQHSRRGALPGCFPWSISHSPGAAHHQPADPRHVRPSTRHAGFATGEVGGGGGVLSSEWLRLRDFKMHSWSLSKLQQQTVSAMNAPSHLVYAHCPSLHQMLWYASDQLWQWCHVHLSCHDMHQTSCECDNGVMYIWGAVICIRPAVTVVSCRFELS